MSGLGIAALVLGGFIVGGWFGCILMSVVRIGDDVVAVKIMRNELGKYDLFLHDQYVDTGDSALAMVQRAEELMQSQHIDKT